MRLRKIDYIIGFLICFICGIIAPDFPINIKSFVMLIVSSLIFAVVFGAITNTLIKKKQV